MINVFYRNEDITRVAFQPTEPETEGTGEQFKLRSVKDQGNYEYLSTIKKLHLINIGLGKERIIKKNCEYRIANYVEFL